MKEVQDHLGQEIKALRHRMEQLETQLDARRLRLGGVERQKGVVVHPTQGALFYLRWERQL